MWLPAPIFHPYIKKKFPLVVPSLFWIALFSRPSSDFFLLFTVSWLFLSFTITEFYGHFCPSSRPFKALHVHPIDHIHPRLPFGFVFGWFSDSGSRHGVSLSCLLSVPRPAASPAAVTPSIFKGPDCGSILLRHTFFFFGTFKKRKFDLKVIIDIKHWKTVFKEWLA